MPVLCSCLQIKGFKLSYCTCHMTISRLSFTQPRAAEHTWLFILFLYSHWDSSGYQEVTSFLILKPTGFPSCSPGTSNVQIFQMLSTVDFSSLCWVSDILVANKWNLLSLSILLICSYFCKVPDMLLTIFPHYVIRNHNPGDITFPAKRICSFKLVVLKCNCLPKHIWVHEYESVFLNCQLLWLGFNKHCSHEKQHRLFVGTRMWTAFCVALICIK